MAVKNAYEPTTLRKVQLVETAMFKEFKKICDENEIDYFIAYGTVIGVFRHKGFIPWDDDIDICMKRSDFERFNEIVSKPPYSDRYEMISAANSDEYLMPEAHWQFKGTKFMDLPSLEFGANLGIFLDLFILDNLADDEKAAKKQIKSAFLWGKLMIIRSIAHPIIPFSGFKGKLIKAVLFVMHYLMKICCISKRWLYKKYTQNATKYNGQKTKYVTDFRSYNIEKIKLTEEEIYPLKEMPFEDTMAKVANNYEKLLNRVYGDYMQIPPVEKQHNHCPEILDFGDSLEYFGIE